MKRVFAFLTVLVFTMVGTAAFVMADGTPSTRKRQSWTAQQTFKNGVVIKNDHLEMYDKEGTLLFKVDVSNGNFTDRQTSNMLNNAALGIWSGGTCFTNAAGSAPDWWLLKDTTNTGVTRVDLADVAWGSGATLYPGQTHGIEVQHVTGGTGNCNTMDYLSYPATGVSSTQAWYRQFQGKKVMFGAWVKTDPDIGGSTNFLRPYILTDNISFNSTANVASHAGTSTMAFGSWASDNNGDWEWLSAVTTMPAVATADAFEVGFQINGTGSVSPTGYICGPTLLIGHESTATVPKHGETVHFLNPLEVYSGGSDFGARLTATAATAIDLSVDPGWNGIVPDDATAMLMTVRGGFASRADILHFYGQNALAGVTLFGTEAGDYSAYYNVWTPISSTGTINVDNIAVVSGVSMRVHAVQMR